MVGVRLGGGVARHGQAGLDVGRATTATTVIAS